MSKFGGSFMITCKNGGDGLASNMLVGSTELREDPCLTDARY